MTMRALLALAFENSAALKAAALDALGKKEVTSYKADGALDQLIAIDAAYLGVIAVANFFFPYVLPCTFFNPVQLLIPPNDPAGVLAALDADLIACREVAKHFECPYGTGASITPDG